MILSRVKGQGECLHRFEHSLVFASYLGPWSQVECYSEGRGWQL